MSRRPTDAHLAAVAETLAEIESAVEAARRNAHKVVDVLPPHQRARATMFSLSAETSDRPGRIALAVRAFGAPAALADEMNSRALTLRQAHDLLSKAAGSARTVTASGVESIRLALTALDVAARDTAARADDDRVRAVADLLHRYRLTGTLAGARVASSKHDPDTLRALARGRADAFGHLSPCAQLALMRDIQLTPVKDAPR